MEKSNLHLLPISDESRDRLRRFIQLHAQHGGIKISIMAAVPDADGTRVHVLVSADSNAGPLMLSDADLLARAHEVFSDENLQGIKLHFTVRNVDPIHVLTADAGFVWWLVKPQRPVLLRVASVWPPVLSAVSADASPRTVQGATHWVRDYAANNHINLRPVHL